MLGTSSYKDIARWEAAHLIDGETAKTLRAELEQHHSRYSLSLIFSILAAVLVGAAVVTFVAANWQDMPRIARVGLICLMIVLGYGLGTWRLMRGDKIFSEGLFLIAAISYGAGIALVGQMYHLSGDERDAILVGCFGVGAASFLLRSPILSSLSILLTCCLLWLPEGDYFLVQNLCTTGLLFLGGIALCYWTKSRLSRHFMMIFLGLLISYFFTLSQFIEPFIACSIAAFYIVLFVIDWLWPQCVEKWTRFSGAFGNWALCFAFYVLWMRQFGFFGHYKDKPFVDKLSVAIIILLLSVVALWSSQQRGWGTRLIALMMFFAEVYYLIWQTIDSLMMQSLFFLIAAIVVFALAYFSVKKHKKIQNGEDA